MTNPNINIRITEEQVRFHADLPTALFAVAGGHANPTLKSGSTQFFDEVNGRAVIRNRDGATRKAPRLTVADALSGAEHYPRPNGDKYYARDWRGNPDVEVLRKGRTLGHYAFFYGAPGTGKTALAEAAFGDELVTILGSGDTEVSDLVGGYVQTITGGFEWIDGPLLIAAEQGRPLLIDEIGLIDPKVLSIVYGLMDGRKEYRVTANPERGTVKAKDGFYIVAATNPNAPGVNISEALLSRFLLHAELTTDWALARKLGVPTQMVTAAQNLDKKQTAEEVSWAPQMRELLAYRDISKEYGSEWAIANLLAQAPEIDRPIVADVFTRVFGIECKPARI